MRKKMNKKAFTLIELLVVIAVIGILVLLGAPRFTGYTQKAELTRIQHDIKVMEQEVVTVLSTNYDDFNKWENNIKDLNQLVQDNELFEKGGPVVDPIDGTYKVIPEEYKDKINTKLKGTFYANIGGKVYYEHGKGPGYSDEEIQDLIDIDFIPVATAEELNNVRINEYRTYGKGTQWEGEYLGGLGKRYVQVKNIDLSEYSEEGWNPIGTFTGTYDGGNYVIRGLEVKGEDSNYQGLFGYTKGATINNVGLIDNKVTGRSYIGGLVGHAYSSTKISNSYATGSVTADKYVGGLVGQVSGGTNISNSYATGSVEGTDNFVGGLVGLVSSSTIESSYATGSVTATGTGDKYVGGLVGHAGSSTIKDSYATGEVTGSGDLVGGLVGSASSSSKISNSYALGSVAGTNQVGGLVGQAYESKISNSYATGSVEGRTDVGGLVGYANSSSIEDSYTTGSVEGSGNYGSVGGLVGSASHSTIKNSYATGSVTGSYRVGGLVAQVYDSSISNSYWDIQNTGLSSSAGEEGKKGEGKSTEEMEKADTYSAWNTDVWNIVNGEYPKLR